MSPICIQGETGTGHCFPLSPQNFPNKMIFSRALSWTRGGTYGPRIWKPMRPAPPAAALRIKPPSPTIFHSTDIARETNSESCLQSPQATWHLLCLHFPIYTLNFRDLDNIATPWPQLPQSCLLTMTHKNKTKREACASSALAVCFTLLIATCFHRLKLCEVFSMWFFLELMAIFFKNISHCDKNKQQINKKLPLRFE